MHGLCSVHSRVRSFLSFATLFVQTLEKTVFVLHDNKGCRFAFHSPATVHSSAQQRCIPPGASIPLLIAPFPSSPAHGLCSVLHSPGPRGPAGLCLPSNSSPGAQVLPSSVFDSLSSLQFAAFDGISVVCVHIPFPSLSLYHYTEPSISTSLRKHWPRLFRV